MSSAVAAILEPQEKTTRVAGSRLDILVLQNQSQQLPTSGLPVWGNNPTYLLKPLSLCFLSLIT